MEFHIPVMSHTVLEYLQITNGDRYIDATLGDGGHSLEILRSGGVVLGLDVNEGSLNRAAKRIREAGFERSFTFIKGNFKEIDILAESVGFSQVKGILFDLGTSTTQLKDDRLGLGFNSDYEPDMRLDDSLSVKAFDLINGLYENELADIFWNYGEERYARKFAREIVKARELERIYSARQLSEIARKSFPGYENGRLHPATRIFMALRIAVNDELENLKSALPRAGRLLLPGGRMLVISFHSLEDKIVKEFAQASQPKNNQHGGEIRHGMIVLRQLVKKPLVPTEQEINQNPSARSAKLRIFEKLL